jgi:SAM-dependent methyltransferase
VKSEDRVLYLGCGPGAAVDEAACRGATVIGVDSGRLLLLGRYMSGPRSGHDISFRRGTIKNLPVCNEDVAAAWTTGSAHHWADRPATITF